MMLKLRLAGQLKNVWIAININIVKFSSFQAVGWIREIAIAVDLVLAGLGHLLSKFASG